MPRIKAAELPPSLVHAFIDALEAWHLVERDLFMIYQLLKHTRDIDGAWHEFTELSTGKQVEETLQLIASKVTGDDDRLHLERVLGRVRRQATKRNHFVHGRWHRIEVVDGRDVHLGYEYIRLYEGRGLSGRPTNHREADAMRGRTRFDAQDLQRAEREFRELARDLHAAIQQLTKYVAPRLR